MKGTLTVRHKLIAILFAALCLYGLASCTEPKSDTEQLFSEDGVYLGFKSMPEYDTPEAALEDGCLVVVSDADGKGSLFGGAEDWTQFLSDSGNGEDSFLRVVHFIDGTAYPADLLYTASASHYFDVEQNDLHDRPYQYLRKLNGTAGSPEREITWYVLTDSQELTFGDAWLSFITNSTDVMESIPDFCWLGFTSWLDEE
jgi:hypothetical protein